jgi:acyl carrier protein
MMATTECNRLIEEISAIVRKAAKLQPGVAITPESRLVEDLMIDSLDLVSLVLQFQEHFDVVIEDEAMPNLRRVGDIFDYLATVNGGWSAIADPTGSRGAGEHIGYLARWENRRWNDEG